MHPLAEAASQMHVLAPALLAHHQKSMGLWAMAQGKDGIKPRLIILGIAALITGVLMNAITSRRRRPPVQY